MKPERIKISLFITIIALVSTLSTVQLIAAQETRYRHDLTVSRHISVPFTDLDADSQLNTANSLLQHDDNACPDEVACCVSFNRDSSVTTFGASGDALDEINNQGELNQVLNQPGHFKVVKEIGWCANQAGDFAGCAIMGQPSAVITASASGAVWAHEFGHNQGLGHNNSCFANIMRSILFNARAVNQDECTAFKAGGAPDGTCEATGIPTLSEWKQIFLTLLMLSLVMGFIPVHSSRYNLKSWTISGIAGVNMIVFNKGLFWSVLKWIGLAVVLGLISAKVVFGHVSPLDIIGTLFCTPLVAYILHLMIMLSHDYKRDNPGIEQTMHNNL